MFEKPESRTRVLKNEAVAVYLAAKDPRTPWYAKAAAICTAAYALSPIDLIPDFIPVLGYLDDLIIVPAGIVLAIRLFPAEVLKDARENGEQAQGPERTVEFIGMAIIIVVWILAIIWSVWFTLQLMDNV
jgi:uncharacterized membrane protein YkvA (DUF1232 family)